MGQLREYKWDHRNRLISVTDYDIEGFSETEGKDLPGLIGQKALVTGADFIKYQYDVLDNLVSKQSGPLGEFPTIETYVVSLGHRVIDFRDAPNEEREIRRRLYAPGVDNLLALDRRTENAAGDPTAATVVWTLTDYQGSLGDLASSVSEQHVDYTAYGVPDGPNYGLASYVDTFYAGRDYDRDTGLYHNRARWYDPAATRFLSEDPIGFAGGDANLYRYAGNAPSMATDARHTKSQPSQSGEFWSNFADLYGWYLNPLHNDPGDDWTFGAGKLLGWGMFVVGSAGAGILAGGGALGGTAFAYSASTTMALAGGTAGAMQVHAANPNAGLHQYAFSVGLGAAFGGRFPTVGLWDFGGTVAGGGVEWAAGGDFYGRGMQWGGLAGTIAGGGLTHGWRMAAWESGGALAGAGLGYRVYGTPEGALHGAYLGTLAGGLAHSASGAYRRIRAPSRSVPQGLTSGQFSQARSIIRRHLGDLADDVVVQGSRARGTAKATSDIDFGLMMSRKDFSAAARRAFPSNPGPMSAKGRTMLDVIFRSRIFRRQARLPDGTKLRTVARQLENALGIRVDFSIVERGGFFDQLPVIRL